MSGHDADDGASEDDEAASEDPLVRATDYRDIVQVESPRLHPDGDRVAFVRRVPDGDDSYEATVYLVDAEGGDPRQFTVAEGEDSQPRFSPSGDRLAFVSTRGADDDRPQLWVMPTTGGEARQVTDVVGGVSGVEWSPDGERIAFVQSRTADDREADRDLHVEDHEPEPPDPRVVDRTIYRGFQRYTDGRRSHVYVLELDGVEPAGDPEDAITRVTDGKRDFAAPAFGDADTLYVAGTPEDVADPDDSLQREVLAHDISSDDHEQVVRTTGYVASIAATTDGRVVYPSVPEERATMQQVDLKLYDRDAEAEHTLTEGFDRTLGYEAAPEWGPREDHVYFATPDRGSVLVRRVAPGESVETVAGEGVHVDGASPGPAPSDNADADGDVRIAVTGSAVDRPADVFVAEPGAEGEYEAWVDGDAPGTESGAGPADPAFGLRRLTDVNDDYLTGKRLGEPESLVFEGPEGPVQGWLLTPPEEAVAERDGGGGDDAATEHPLVVEIHGGPHAMWSTAGTMFHEFRTLAARGYAVFWCNPRGSTGYGQAFEAAIERDWGAVTLADVEAGLDRALETAPIDDSEVYVTGGSFGGFMTAWAVGHSDRYRAAVSQRGVYDLPGFYGTSDAYRLVEDEFALPWEEPGFVREQSPSAAAHAVETPTLLIHSDRDYRTPANTAEQFYRHLRKAGTDTRMVRYPREGHELSRSGEPAHVVDRIDRIARWFDGYSELFDAPLALDRERNDGLSASEDGEEGEEEGTDDESAA